MSVCAQKEAGIDDQNTDGISNNSWNIYGDKGINGDTVIYMYCQGSSQGERMFNIASPVLFHKKKKKNSVQKMQIILVVAKRVLSYKWNNIPIPVPAPDMLSVEWREVQNLIFTWIYQTCLGVSWKKIRLAGARLPCGEIAFFSCTNYEA